MQYVWLEQLEKCGSISRAAKAEIYSNCSPLLKEADAKPGFFSLMKEKLTESLKNPDVQAKLKQALSGAVGAGFGALMTSYKQKRSIQKNMDQLIQVRHDILAMPEFGQHPEKAEARLVEIAKLAPTVAVNKPLLVSILKEKLHSGLTAADAQQLSIIQASFTDAPLLSLMQKKASAEEFADTYLTVVEMAKEAGLEGKTVTQFLTNTLAMAGLSVAGGIGVGAVKELIAHRDRKELNKKLSDSFSEAMRQSKQNQESQTEVIHANPERARQAFQTMVHFAPHAALDPYAARSFMNKIVNYYDHTGVGTDEIKSLSEIERNIRSISSGSPFFQGLADGTKAFGLGKALEGSIGAVSKPLHSELEAMVATDLRKKSK